MTEKHAVTVAGYEDSLAKLGTDIADLRYDALLAVIHALSLRVYEQMQVDSEENRTKLAGKLSDAYVHLVHARHDIQIAWVLCRPHMAESLAKDAEIREGQIYGY